MIKKLLYSLLIVVVLLVLYILLWPVPIDPVAWTAPAPPELSGEFASNTSLAVAERLGEGIAVGPEDVAVDADGRIYGGFEDGKIISFANDGSNHEVFVDTGGRPLGMEFDDSGDLIVADAFKGLLSISPEGKISVLFNDTNFANDLEIASDGTIYFSDASTKFQQDSWRLDFYEHRPHGRLLAYYPGSKTTAVLLEGLYFANGVAVSPDQSFVLVVETTKYRIQRYWLNGPKQGKTEIFTENLPGIPDGLSSDGKGRFWLAMATGPKTRKKIDALLPNPFMRTIIARLPSIFHPAPERFPFVLGFDMEGTVIHNLQDPQARAFAFVTSVREYGGMLYLGSLYDNAIGRLPAPKPEAVTQSIAAPS